jgi:hypothetical protein
LLIAFLISPYVLHSPPISPLRYFVKNTNYETQNFSE